MMAHSSYLSRLTNKFPDQIHSLINLGPQAAFDALMTELSQTQNMSRSDFSRHIRQTKEKVHLCLAVLDFGGVWNTAQIIRTFSDFADCVIDQCVQFSWSRLNEQRQQGEVVTLEQSGFFIVAFGKLGGNELNYSSDVDLAFFYDRQSYEIAEPLSDRAFIRACREIVSLLSEITEYGYVFRVDLRIRPDPASTPIALSTDAALSYYETVGQTWERSAWIKSRIISGDAGAGAEFFNQIYPFIWRKNLDFAAIEDIHQIRQQILFGSHQPQAPTAGFNVKLGVGGIREIELFVQTLQLIHGGRKPNLQTRNTVEGLARLVVEGLVTETTANRLSKCYYFLRQVEHALQMVDDRQTHELPASLVAQLQFQGLLGYADPKVFAKKLSKCTSDVARQSNRFFGAKLVEKTADILHISGFENHPDALRRIEQAGFKDPVAALSRLRGWMSGKIRATRSERSRRLLARIAPELIAAFVDTRDPDGTFVRFAQFFEALPAGVQILSLFANCPGLLARVIDILQLAPMLTSIMINRPNVIEALLEQNYEHLKKSVLLTEISRAKDMELAMNVARKMVQEELFLIGSKLLSATAEPAQVAEACSVMAAATISGLAQRVGKELAADDSNLPVEWAVLALGKLGSCEMMPGSDLDIMIVYRAITNTNQPIGQLAPEVWGVRFTRKLIAALSAPTSEGLLYQVDMKLRPSGKSGPIAVEITAFSNYYQQDAWVWEFQALTRARVICASNKQFRGDIEACVSTNLMQMVNKSEIRNAISRMRRKILQTKPALGLWDIKHGLGSLTELEFIFQAIQLMAPDIKLPQLFLIPATEITTGNRYLSPTQSKHLSEAHLLYHRILQITGIAIGRIAESSQISQRLQQVLVTSAGVDSFLELEQKLHRNRIQVASILDQVLSPEDDGIAD